MKKISLTQLKQRCNDPIEAFYTLGDHINRYTFIDKGASILGVGHLDTVLPKVRHFNVSSNKVNTPQLDDRLGVYTMLDVLPDLGVQFDVLLTEDEEIMMSTAQNFIAPRPYNWIFELDRAGTDVVLYEYDTPENRQRCVDAGWTVGHGSYSDICDLDHLERAAFNFGIGYYAPHYPHCYMVVSDWMYNVERFVKFYQQNKNRVIEHEKIQYTEWGWKDDYLVDGIYQYTRDDRCPLCDSFYVDDENLESLYKTGYCIECDTWMIKALLKAQTKKGNNR